MRSQQKDAVLRKVSFKLRLWLILFCQCLDSIIEAGLFWRVTGLNLRSKLAGFRKSSVEIRTTPLLGYARPTRRPSCLGFHSATGST